MTRPTNVHVASGPLAAVLIGLALQPLRELTPASNLTFAFMALTIVMAELGGRTAAVATALVSSLSLDFFLTRPYWQLRIEDHHDVVAFVGLALCGLLVAGLAGDRGGRGGHRASAREPSAGAGRCAACDTLGTAMPDGAPRAARLQAELNVQRLRAMWLAWLKTAALLSGPLWLNALFGIVPAWVAWLIELLEGLSLVMAAGLASLLAVWRVRLRDVELAPAGAALHVPWDAWDEVRAALWSALALAGGVVWTYSALDRAVPSSLLGDMTGLAAATFVLTIGAETISLRLHAR